jgi:trehalose-6-phosphate synthase
MPIEERRDRREALYAKVCEYDVNRWQQEFLTALVQDRWPLRSKFHAAEAEEKGGAKHKTKNAVKTQ